MARRLGERLGREVVECDAYIEQQAGKTIPEIFAEGGETAFRRLETEALRELGKRSGIILSTGGGCVTRSENYPLLHQNGTIFWAAAQSMGSCRATAVRSRGGER